MFLILNLTTVLCPLNKYHLLSYPCSFQSIDVALFEVLWVTKASSSLQKTGVCISNHLDYWMIHSEIYYVWNDKLLCVIVRKIAEIWQSYMFKEIGIETTSVHLKVLSLNPFEVKFYLFISIHTVFCFRVNVKHAVFLLNFWSLTRNYSGLYSGL